MFKKDELNGAVLKRASASLGISTSIFDDIYVANFFVKHSTSSINSHFIGILSVLIAVADLRGGARGTRAPPSGPKFLHFHAVFGKNWPNNRLAAPPLWG